MTSTAMPIYQIEFYDVLPDMIAQCLFSQDISAPQNCTRPIIFGKSFRVNFTPSPCKISINVPLNMLLFRVGHSMRILSSEVKKLCFYAKANNLGAVSAKDVLEVSSSTDEGGDFDLSNAVLDGNIRSVYAALASLKADGTDAGAVLGMLERIYTELAQVAMLLDEGREKGDIDTLLKFHPYKTQRIIKCVNRVGSKRIYRCIDLLRQMDAASKSGGVSGYTPVEIFLSQNI